MLKGMNYGAIVTVFLFIPAFFHRAKGYVDYRSLAEDHILYLDIFNEFL